MKIYQVDAFNNQIFKGNPAAVIPLNRWIDDFLMQQIAEENNLSETVFFVETKNYFEIRWFTPTCEVDLCGHATLAASHIIFSELNYTKDLITFQSKSGELTVFKNNEWYTLNFPSEEIQEISIPKNLEEGLNAKVLKCFKGKSELIAIFDNEEEISNLKPNYNTLLSLDFDGIIVTSKGNNVDFVSRFFAPKIGINEDPVTGSAHTFLIPYWSKKFDKVKLEAKQISKREGILKFTYLNDRVEII